MNYIVLDMEWNELGPVRRSARRVLPVPEWEIVRIGAVRLVCDPLPTRFSGDDPPQVLPDAEPPR